MTLTRRTLGLILLGTGACLLAGSASRLFAASTPLGAGQDPPNRREFSIRASDYRFSPDRLEVMQDDLVKLTVESADVAYSFTIDEPYRVSRRIPAGGKAVIEFRADQPGTFDFYSNMTNDARHAKMRGQLTVRRR